MPKIPKPGFYAVRVGRCPGIYHTWDECKQQVTGHPGATYKKFYTKAEAEDFVRDSDGPIWKVKLGPVSTSTQATDDGTVRHPDSFLPVHTKPFPQPSPRPHPHPLLSPLPPPSPSYLATALLLFFSIRFTTAFPTLAQRVGSIPLSLASSPQQGNIIVVYTDGASSKNGTKNARAGFGAFFGPNDPRNISGRLAGPKQTNQRAEVTAAIRAIETCGDDYSTLEIRTDSMYLIKAITIWHKSWVQRDWRNSEGAPVENRDLFEYLLELVQRRPGRIIWTHVRGHSGNHGNDMADRLAVAGAAMEVVPSAPAGGRPDSEGSKPYPSVPAGGRPDSEGSRPYPSVPAGGRPDNEGSRPYPAAAAPVTRYDDDSWMNERTIAEVEKMTRAAERAAGMRSGNSGEEEKGGKGGKGRDGRGRETVG